MPDKTCTIQNNAFCFLQGDRRPDNTAGSGLLGKIQEKIKQHGVFYYLLLKIFAPILLTRQCKRTLDSLLDSYDETAVILNVGSGPQFLNDRRDIINVDLYAFDEVDIVSDASGLPIKNNTVDLVINIAMLEHVESPDSIIREMHRVLKKGGHFFCYLPFIAPFHAAPHDYHRWTEKGAANVFAIFQHSEIGIGAGPTSGMLWVLQEWLAILFSFGSRTLHDMLFVLLMMSTAPLKLLDLLMVRFPNADKIAGSFYITGKK